MFNKSFLINKIVNSLIKREYQVFLAKGCFEIAAKREFLLLIKSLINVDALNEEQALSLRAISYFLSAYPFIISLKNSREFLRDEIVYSRFELPVVSPKLFESIIEGEEILAILSAKGRHTVEINSFALKKKRKELKLTLEELAELAGITKKALYEIENKRVNPTLKTVKKLESILKVDLKSSYKMRSVEPVYLKPKDEFQEKVGKELLRIGIDNSSVFSAPFEIVGREKFSLITGLSRNTNKIKKNAITIKKLSSIFSSSAVFVAKKLEERTIEGIPVILESELEEMEDAKEFRKIIAEKKI